MDFPVSMTILRTRLKSPGRFLLVSLLLHVALLLAVSVEFSQPIPIEHFLGPKAVTVSLEFLHATPAPPVKTALPLPLLPPTPILEPSWQPLPKPVIVDIPLPTIKPDGWVPLTRATPVAAAPAPATKTTEKEKPLEIKPASGGNFGEHGVRNKEGISDPGISKSYLAELSAWLERHKQYPEKARLYRMEGSALVYFQIDRQGHILEYRLLESTGYEELDEAISAMVEASNPVPQPPDELYELRFSIPVSFTIK